MEIYTVYLVSFTAVLQLQYLYKYDNWNLFKNRSLWVMQKCIKEDFPQLLELPQLRRHIGGCFQSVCKAAVSRIFRKYLGKQTWRNPFKVELWENSRLSKSLNYCEGKAVKNWNSLFFVKLLYDLNYNYLLHRKKVRVVVFLSWSKRLSSHFSKLISQLTEAAL